MAILEKVQPKELQENWFTMFDDDWALITARDGEKWNTMTIGWGSVGWLWNKPVCTAYVRESRYTKQFVDRSDRFSISFFDRQECRQQLGRLGRESGRDMDKMQDSGLTPLELDGEIVFQEAKCVFICKKMYADLFDPAKCLSPEVMERAYSGANQGDFHAMYTAEIVSAYRK